jgi:hypothetical protein
MFARPQPRSNPRTSSSTPGRRGREKTMVERLLSAASGFADGVF